MVPHYLLVALFTLSIQATTYNATFTWYGQGDERNSPNCSTSLGDCGFYTHPGFSAAVSQNLYGSADGKGPYCGKCLKLNAVRDPYTNKTLQDPGKDVIVKINNLCPVKDTTGKTNPLCSQSSLTATNGFGANIDVNVCADSGAHIAVFGSASIGLAFGTAEEVDCDAFNGSTATSAIASATSSSSVAPSETKKSDGSRVRVSEIVVLLTMCSLII